MLERRLRHDAEKPANTDIAAMEYLRRQIDLNPVNLSITTAIKVSQDELLTFSPCKISF